MGEVLEMISRMLEILKDKNLFLLRLGDSPRNYKYCVRSGEEITVGEGFVINNPEEIVKNPWAAGMLVYHAHLDIKE